MQLIDTLIAIEEIKQVKARYCRTVDTQDWPGYASVFTADAVLHPSSSAAESGGGDMSSKRGVEAIVAWVSGALQNAHSVHHVLMPEIELTSPTTATGIWAMEDRVEWPDRVLRGFGHYSETYRRIEQGWRIASTTLTRLRCSIDARTRLRTLPVRATI